ncbi:hypothetical protein PAXRUDRAFT_441515 [Paxillus rubicundulus Ve08.2h10]|uniref:Unplaced genomic scaffold scaffold_2765, whole genome shotgun sequence n=1 Tax=Paxillus rubicundulus Ve08.2h10 TaxID=930991 RepID=A0A0D0CLT4_9AGAM|nr:hypothetical protein PAXRUDRAFT_441515 [Paxillus rubicundulus Ve08.2h10]
MHGPLRGPPITLSSYLLTLVHSGHSRAIHPCPSHPNYHLNSPWVIHPPLLCICCYSQSPFICCRAMQRQLPKPCHPGTCCHPLIPPPGDISPEVIHPKPCHLLHISTHCHTILHNLSNSLLFYFIEIITYYILC